nr:Chain B, FWLPANLW peptide [Saccharomyces cerevisiae]
FWLPANLW